MVASAVLGTVALSWIFSSAAAQVVVSLIFLPLAFRLTYAVEAVAFGSGNLHLQVVAPVVKGGEHPAGTLAVIYPVILSEGFDFQRWSRSLAQNVHNNPGPLTRHVILVDLPDAKTQRAAGDDRLVAAATAAVEAATDGGGTRVDLLTRARRWAPLQHTYMGWERKRGKIDDFVTAATNGTWNFTERISLQGIRYAQVLDDGSVLQPGAADVLVTLFDEPDHAPSVEAGVVTRGYGVFQSNRAWPVGLRPSHLENLYGAATARPLEPVRPADWSGSDFNIAMKRYGEDFYTGQAAFDVSLYQNVLHGKIPPDTVLSHDKLEGFHLRVARTPYVLISDVGPRSRKARRAAAERWSRGDLQLFPWVIGSQRRGRARLRPHHRWWLFRDVVKIFEPTSLCLLVALSLTLPPTSGLLLCLLALASFVAERLATAVRPHLPNRVRRSVLLLAGVQLVTALDDAVNQSAAAWRTLTRAARGRDLLEWTPSRSVDNAVGHPSGGSAAASHFALAKVSVALALIGGVAASLTGNIPVAVLCTVWAAAPLITSWSDRPTPGAV